MHVCIIIYIYIKDLLPRSTYVDDKLYKYVLLTRV